MIGDFNSQIGEVATSIHGVIRNKASKHSITYTSYRPNNNLCGDTSSLNNEQKKYANKIYKLKETISVSKKEAENNPFLESVNPKFINSLEENEKCLRSDSEILERLIASDESGDNLRIWYDISIENTHSKIRTKKTDYYNVKFMNLVYKFLEGKEIDSWGCFLPFKETVSQTSNKKGKKESLVKDAFLSWSMCLRKKNSIPRARDQLNELISSLIIEEKFDYILLSFKNSFNVNEIYEIENGANHLKFGIPSESLSSDHLPVHVKLKVSFVEHLALHHEEQVSIKPNEIMI